MRLIDAEALREKILAMPTDGDILQPFIDKFGVVGAIDASPTIACSTCTHAPCDPHWCPSMSLYEPKEKP